MVVDDMFGGGTIPLEHGDGVNVLIDFLGPAQDRKPLASRSVENLKRAPAGRMRTTSFTTGIRMITGTVTSATPQLLIGSVLLFFSADHRDE